MKYFRKNISNILFVVFIVFLFTPYGLPVRAILIKGVSFVTTRIFSLEIDKEDQIHLTDYDWRLQGVDGEQINMESFKNKVVLVNFWATWCPPCVAEMPSMKALYEDYKKKVTFLFITNENWNTVSNFYTKNAYNFPTYNQVTSTPKELENSTIPATFVLSKDKTYE